MVAASRSKPRAAAFGAAPTSAAAGSGAATTAARATSTAARRMLNTTSMALPRVARVNPPLVASFDGCGSAGGQGSITGVHAGEIGEGLRSCGLRLLAQHHY